MSFYLKIYVNNEIIIYVKIYVNYKKKNYRCEDICKYGKFIYVTIDAVNQKHYLRQDICK